MNTVATPADALAELARRELARRHTVDLAWWLSPTHTYERWHHEVGEALDWLSRMSAAAQSPRLLVEGPPGHGKTDLTGRTATIGHMGRNPGHSTLYATHTHGKAVEVGDEIRVRARRAAMLWPHLAAPPDDGKQVGIDTMALWYTAGGGFCKAVGVGDPTAGSHVSQALLDDPFANAEGAASLSERDRVWKWIGSDIDTRLSRYGGGLGMTHTRWNVDDAAGRVRAAPGTKPWPGAANAVGGVWYVMSHPAIAEVEGADWRKVGEALCPRTMGLDKLETIRALPTMTPTAWNALYQQRPVADGGNVIQRDWTTNRHRYDHRAAMAMRWDSVWISADLTFGRSATSDYCSLQVWGRHGPNRYLLDRVNARMTYPEARAAMRDLCSRWRGKVGPVLVERAANGRAMVDELEREIAGMIAVPVTSQVVPGKFGTTAYLWQAGNVWLPAADIAPWVGEYVEQIVSVPSAPHDDDAAATAHALTWSVEQDAAPSFSAADHAAAAAALSVW